MKTLIYSDVHGNLPAFEKMLKVEQDCEQYICLGDLVNYAPWSNECVDLALSLPNSILLMGNHEQAFLNKKYDGSNELVQLFFAQTIKDFTQYKEISQFIEAYTLDKFQCQHTILDQYIYPDMTMKVFAGLSSQLNELTPEQIFILCDPQTSGGLLASVYADKVNDFQKIISDFGLDNICAEPIGRILIKAEKTIFVS